MIEEIKANPTDTAEVLREKSTASLLTGFRQPALPGTRIKMDDLYQSSRSSENKDYLDTDNSHQVFSESASFGEAYTKLEIKLHESRMKNSRVIENIWVDPNES